MQALYQALLTARENTEAPSFIALSTIIGWPPRTSRTPGPRTGRRSARTRWRRPRRSSASIRRWTSRSRTRRSPTPARSPSAARHLHAEWEEAFAAWAEANPDRKALFDRLAAHALPAGWAEALPSFPADAKGIATRKASGTVLTALAPVLPELWGGSADLAESNLTTMAGEPSFIPVDRQTAMWPGNPYGRTLHFGIREHGMGAILNGIALHGGTRPYGGTFLVFSDYMRGSVRLRP